MSDRLEKLKILEEKLYVAMELADSKTVAPIAKQYRETIREIEEIEGAGGNDDEIGEILGSREANGKPGAVRKNRSGVYRE